MSAFQVFKTDGGATYMVECNEDGHLVFTGQNVRVPHVSPDNAIVVTGKRRNQGTMGGAFPFSVGFGCRAVMTFDTGEGLSRIPGVILN